MPLFPVLETEALVQASDKTRLDASKSYGSGGATITKIEIRPDASAAFYDVTADQYLDWQYTKVDAADPETVTATVRINYVSVGEPGTSVDKTLQVISAATDNLFSTDDELRKHEYDILKYVPAGRATFKDVHRRAQTLILDWLSKEGYVDDFGKRITKEKFRNLNEIQTWSAMLALQLIFEGLSNAIDDVFSEKAKRYAGLVSLYKDRSVIRLDLDESGTVEDHEGLDVRTAVVVRR